MKSLYQKSSHLREDHLVSILEQGLTLEEIDLPFFSSHKENESSLTNKILEQNKNCVKKLRISALEDARFLQIPTLEKLEILELGLSDYGYFPDAFNLNEKFPHLSQVLLGFHPSVERFEAVFAPGVFPSVQHLDVCLWGCGSSDVLEKLGPMFPSIKVFTLRSDAVSTSSLLSKSFKLWPGLEILVLEVDFTYDFDLNLDSAVTGIPVRSLKRLKYKSFSSEFLNLKKEPSISDLQSKPGLDFVQVIT